MKYIIKTADNEIHREITRRTKSTMHIKETGYSGGKIIDYGKSIVSIRRLKQLGKQINPIETPEQVLQHSVNL